jgi:hypothetical protein
MAAPVGRSEDLARREPIVGRPAGLVAGGRGRGKRRVAKDGQPVGVLEIVVGAEAEGVDLPLRRGVHPPTLIARERALLVVGRDDVLAQLRPHGLQHEAQVPGQREVPQDGVLALDEVVGRHATERRARGSTGAAKERGLRGHVASMPIARPGYLPAGLLSQHAGVPARPRREPRWPRIAAVTPRNGGGVTWHRAAGGRAPARAGVRPRSGGRARSRR